MDIEELKLILAAVQAAGQGAYFLGITWFVVVTLKYLLGIGLGLIGIILLFRFLIHLVNIVSFGARVLAVLGSGTILEYLTVEEARKHLEQIRQWKEGR